MSLTFAQRRLLADRAKVLDDKVLESKIKELSTEFERLKRDCDSLKAAAFREREADRAASAAADREYRSKISTLRAKRHELISAKTKIGLGKLIAEKKQEAEDDAKAVRKWAQENWWWALSKSERGEWRNLGANAQRKLRYDTIGDLEKGRRWVRDE